MVNTIFLAQSSGSKITKTNKALPINESQGLPLLLFASGGLVLALVGVIVYGKILVQNGEKKLKLE